MRFPTTCAAAAREAREWNLFALRQAAKNAALHASVESERETCADDCRRQNQTDRKIAKTAPDCLLEHRSLPGSLGRCIESYLSPRIMPR
jgi:hypothetical protein